MPKRAIIWLSISAMIFLAYGFWIHEEKTPAKNSKVDYAIVVTDFQDCVKAGNPVMESYPRKCSADGKTFTEDIGNLLMKKDLITVESPLPNDEVGSPLRIKGSARGNWYFEASFPVYLYDENGREISRGIAQAEGEWMTTEFVPFDVTLEFDEPQGKKGELVFKKDNPSGLPENDDELNFPVYFK